MKKKIIILLRYVKYFIFYNYYVMRNKKLDFFQYEKLAVNFPIFSKSLEPGIIGNKCYGNLWAVKNALGSKFEKESMIEHGLYFGEYVINSECQIKGLKTIYTYGKYRLEALQKSNIYELKHINIKTIGPYIQYVNNFSNKNKLIKIKKMYGKILLVFPYHSSPERDSQFDTDNFIDKIKVVASNYDSVFISMFWLDIVYGNHKLYVDAGFTIVSSGHRNDPYFLQRQRDLIDLADMTMSNEIGTHIGYCICLGKPHFLYSQKICTTPILNKPSDNFDDEYKNILRKERAYLSEIFSSSIPEITDKQIKVVEYYWGKKTSS